MTNAVIASMMVNVGTVLSVSAMSTAATGAFVVAGVMGLATLASFLKVSPTTRQLRKGQGPSCGRNGLPSSVGPMHRHSRPLFWFPSHGGSFCAAQEWNPWVSAQWRMWGSGGGRSAGCVGRDFNCPGEFQLSEVSA